MLPFVLIAINYGCKKKDESLLSDYITSFWYASSEYKNYGGLKENERKIVYFGEEEHYKFEKNSLFRNAYQFNNNHEYRFLEDSSVYGNKKLYRYPIQKSFGDVWCGKENSWEIKEDNFIRIACVEYKYNFIGNDTLLLFRKVVNKIEYEYPTVLVRYKNIPKIIDIKE